MMEIIAIEFEPNAVLNEEEARKNFKNPGCLMKINSKWLKKHKRRRPYRMVKYKLSDDRRGLLKYLEGKVCYHVHSEEFTDEEKEIHKELSKQKTRYRLKIKPAIVPEERHEIEEALKDMGYIIIGGGTHTDMSACDITFDGE